MPSVKVLVLFGIPIDKEHFDRHFDATHCPLLTEIPALEKIGVSAVEGAIIGESPVYRVVELLFESEAAMREGLNSEVGQSMARDFDAFATGGVTVLVSRWTSYWPPDAPPRAPHRTAS
jgi:uncharacterized protein (TIGR02118 family)